MGRAVFIARDPANLTEARLEDLVPEVHGVSEWEVDSNGRVVIEYDETTTSAANIEKAFAGLGFDVNHIADTPAAGDATATQNSVRGYQASPER